MTKIGSGSFRLFLAAVVVLNHSTPLRAGSWAVYVFFILSGYWISRLWRSRYLQTCDPVLTFLVSRWWRLIPVFLVCSCLSVGSNLLLNDPSTPRLASDPVWWLRQLLIAGSQGAAIVLPPSWSLDVEMQFYLCAPLLLALFGHIKPVFRGLAAAGGCIWFVLFAFGGGDPHLPHLSLFLGFFLAGVTLDMAELKPSHSAALGSLVAFFGISLALAIFPTTRGIVWTDGTNPILSAGGEFLFSAFRRLWMVAGAGLIIPFLVWNVSQVSGRFDRMLGNLAYPLYLFHWIPRTWYIHFSRSTDSTWQHCTLLLINILVAVIGALVILLLVDQPSERRRAAWVASRNRVRAREERDSGPADRVPAGLERLLGALRQYLRRGSRSDF
jgi:peptidoglycan/LPS O-acetylase OafA/YrhL